jgi:hypothetical protein
MVAAMVLTFSGCVVPPPSDPEPERFSIDERKEARVDPPVDPDGRTVDYNWSQISGPDIGITDPTVEFVAPEVCSDIELRFKGISSNEENLAIEIVVLIDDQDVGCDTSDPCVAKTCSDDGLCVAGPVHCDDQDPCTFDACVEGRCLSEPMTCDDGSACTMDQCQEGACVHEQLVCDDGVYCNGVQPCDAETGACGSAETPCKLGEVCLEHLRTCDPTVIVLSTFDFDDEGWRISGNGASTVPQWLISDGNPGGAIGVNFRKRTPIGYWEAPAWFLGDLSIASDGSLTFDTLITKEAVAQGPLVRIRGQAGTLEYFHSLTPPSGWTSWSVPLRPAAGWQEQTTGRLPTAETFAEVLADVHSLSIRGEYTGFPVNPARLDNAIIRKP